MDNKELILSLIKDDLIHSKLVFGLNALKLGTDEFVLRLSETVFELMKIETDERGEQLYENYLQMREQVNGIEMNELDVKSGELAAEIYLQLAAAEERAGR